jgi:HAD superfamily hydrolase (TIGR01549 family)
MTNRVYPPLLAIIPRMSSHNSIQAILFDLDGTLRHNHPNGFEAFIEYLAELGHTLSLPQILRAERWNHYYWATSSDLKTDIEALGEDTPAFWTRHAERMLLAFEVNHDNAALAQRIHQMFTERYKPINHVPEEVLPTLERLRSIGYTLGLVSNRVDPLDPLVLEFGFTGLFQFTLSAGQAQSWKPAPEIFLQAAALARCAPEAAVYVGDNYYADVEGARGAGLQPILIDPKGIFPEPGCPVIRALSEIEMALDGLGTKSEAPTSVI